MGGPLDGKKEYVKEDFKSQKYFIHQRQMRVNYAEGCCYYEPKTVVYYPKKIRVAGMHGDVEEFMFMVNDPYMSEIALIEKLISGHRSMRR